ncbi:hypothetical protein [Nocardia nova]|uniref:hypothetical protein n=1 Tax=Nocardia nova TaxID=37330 RepID=UPI0033FA0CFF
MTGELPYDDDANADDDAGDAAYRVATGVARVARAGAYVTGGALIASNGAPAPQNESHNSRIAGWSTADPHPDVPSPVVTYPDPSPDSVPPDLGASAPAVPAPGNVLPEQMGTDAIPGFQWSFTENGQPPAGDVPGVPDGSGGAVPYWSQGSGEIFPGSSSFMPEIGPGQGYAVPGMNSASAPATGAPDAAGRFPGSDAFDPSHPAGMLPGQGLGLPGANGLHIPGMNGFAPGGFGSGATESGYGTAPEQPGDGHGAVFDGVGDGPGFGVWLDVDSTLNAHVGLDGIWVQAETTAHLTVGDVGSQLDDFGQWLGAGSSHVPGVGQVPGMPGTAAEAADPLGQGVADAAVIGAAGATSGQSGATHAAGTGVSASGPSGPIAPQAAAAPAPVAPSFPAPQNPAPMVNVAAPQPISPAPVAPALPAPVAAPAPALAQPVAATPLQTTIQPEAATHPVANVFTTHPGPSPLTAPALAVPALFDDPPRHGGSDIRLPGHDADDPSDTTASHTGRTTTQSPNTGTSGASHTSTSPHPSTGDHGGITLPGTSTGHQSTDHTTPTVTPPRDTDGPTRTPGTTTSDSDSGPGHVTTPETTDSDPTTSGHTATHVPGAHTGTDTSVTGDADDSALPSHTQQPSDADQDWTSSQHSAPSTQSGAVPTREPTVQTHEPTVPTHEPTVPTPRHTVDPFPGDTGMPSHTAHVEPPTVNKPPTIDSVPHVPVKPAALPTDSYDTSLWPDSGHSVTSVAAYGLDGGLHETAAWHHAVGDPVAAVHPVFDSHISL